MTCAPGAANSSEATESPWALAHSSSSALWTRSCPSTCWTGRPRSSTRRYTASSETTSARATSLTVSSTRSPRQPCAAGRTLVPTAARRQVGASVPVSRRRGTSGLRGPPPQWALPMTAAGSQAEPRPPGSVTSWRTAATPWMPAGAAPGVGSSENPAYDGGSSSRIHPDGPGRSKLADVERHELGAVREEVGVDVLKPPHDSTGQADGARHHVLVLVPGVVHVVAAVLDLVETRQLAGGLPEHE